MTELFWIASLIFTTYMCIDCINRKEHFVWIIVMIVLMPVGAIAYFFAVKNRVSAPSSSNSGDQSSNVSKPSFFAPSQPRKELDTEETLQLKELIGKYDKAYHHEKLGQIYLEQKKYDLAIEPFQEAVKRDPEMNEARYGLAKCYYGQGRFSESAEVLEELVQIDKKFDYGNAIFGLAECYRLSGQEDKALETYEAVINSYHFFKAYYHYAKLLDKRGKKQEAIDYMKSIIGSSKDLPDYKLEKERRWIDEAYKFLRKNGIELA